MRLRDQRREAGNVGETNHGHVVDPLEPAKRLAPEPAPAKFLRKLTKKLRWASRALRLQSQTAETDATCALLSTVLSCVIIGNGSPSASQPLASTPIAGKTNETEAWGEFCCGALIDANDADNGQQHRRPAPFVFAGINVQTGVTSALAVRAIKTPYRTAAPSMERGDNTAGTRDDEPGNGDEPPRGCQEHQSRPVRARHPLG